MLMLYKNNTENLDSEPTIETMMKCFRYTAQWENCHLPVEMNVDIFSEQFSKILSVNLAQKNITLWMLFISVRMVSFTVSYQTYTVGFDVNVNQLALCAQCVHAV